MQLKELYIRVPTKSVIKESLLLLLYLFCQQIFSMCKSVEIVLVEKSIKSQVESWQHYVNLVNYS